jgi:dipeptide/tripeptide permease
VESAAYEILGSRQPSYLWNKEPLTVTDSPVETQEKLGFIQQIKSFPQTFWIANIIELVERFSFWGVRVVSALYIVEAVEEGGLGFDNTDKGIFFGTWALIQCALPMFTGGFSDRYGYRASLMVAYVTNMIGYGLMAYVQSWWGFMAACCLVGTGTAIFKPPLHGTLAHCVTKSNSSVGWGIFYQVVNIGGFIGPMVMGYLRLLEWKYAFFASAGIIIVNVFITLFFLKDYSKGEKTKKTGESRGALTTFFDSILTLFREPKLLVFLMIFSGFWFMFMQLFDQLSIFIDQWVDTNDVAVFFADLTGMQFFEDLAADGGQFNPEWIVNVDAGAIILLVVLIAYITSFFRHISAMIVGMFISCLGLVIAGYSTTGFICVLGIFIFAIGEMACSPKFSEYVGLIAPPDKKALYMGYSNIPFAIGWAGANYIGGPIYQQVSDKVGLARDYLITKLGQDSQAVAELTRGEVFPRLMEALGKSERASTQLLYEHYNPQYFFYFCIGIGLLSTLAMIGYYFWAEAGKRNQAEK